MSVITISRGSYSRGKEIAEKLADRLGYRVISRDVLLEASEHFNIPEIKLVRALHDSPSVLNRFTYGKEKYIAFIREALLEAIERDNVIYHGLAGHFLIKKVPHLMKVRIIANIEDRIKEEMERENLTAEKALYILRKDDEERRKWSRHLYGIDTADSSLYDIVIHIDKLNVENAIDLLENAAKMPCFQSTDESKKVVRNMLVASRVQVRLIEKLPKVTVDHADGVTRVGVEADISQQEKIEAQVREMVGGMKEVGEVKVYIIPVLTRD